MFSLGFTNSFSGLTTRVEMLEVLKVLIPEFISAN